MIGRTGKEACRRKMGEGTENRLIKAVVERTQAGLLELGYMGHRSIFCRILALVELYPINVRIL